MEILRCFILVLMAYHSVSMVAPYYGIDRPSFEYELPPLEYGFSELEPHMDEETVRVHYLGHHSKYTERMNAVFKEWRIKDKQFSRRSIVDILRNLSSVPEKWRTPLRNNGGGFVNHNIYWSILSPNFQGIDRTPEGSIAEKIEDKWGSYAVFRQEFTEAATNLFGSGYVWLCRNYTADKRDSELTIMSTQNQDSPLGQNLYPVAVIDIWEHAYYLKHKNLRNKYIESWWKLLDWVAVQQLDEWWKGARLHDEL